MIGCESGNISSYRYDNLHDTKMVSIKLGCKEIIYIIVDTRTNNNSLILTVHVVNFDTQSV
jgi:hypothetical protein